MAVKLIPEAAHAAFQDVITSIEISGDARSRWFLRCFAIMRSVCQGMHDCIAEVRIGLKVFQYSTNFGEVEVDPHESVVGTRL